MITTKDELDYAHNRLDKLEQLVAMLLNGKVVRLKSKQGTYRLVHDSVGTRFVSTNYKDVLDVYCNLEDIVEILES